MQQTQRYNNHLCLTNEGVDRWCMIGKLVYEASEPETRKTNTPDIQQFIHLTTVTNERGHPFLGMLCSGRDTHGVMGSFPQA